MTDTTKRDHILVERVTNGRYCHDECFGRDIRFGYSCGVFDEQVQACCHAVAYRCEICLATPSAVVLTEEMMQAINTIRRGFYRLHNACDLGHEQIYTLRAGLKAEVENTLSVDASLRAASPTIFGGAK